MIDSEKEQKRAQAVVDTFSLPPEIQRVNTSLAVDADGLPSLSLSFVVEVTVSLDRETIARLSRFMREVSQAVLESGVLLFPYVTLDEAA